MEVDGLTPVATGPRGVVGGLLERLEREALAEQADLERAASAGARNSGSPAAGPADLPTYVPGQKRKQVPAPNSPAVNGGSNHANGTASTSSAGPPVSYASTSTVKSAHGGPASTSMQASTSRGSSQGGHNHASSPGGGKDESTTNTAAAPPAAKKPRRQPTIRMAFTFPPYPPGVEPRAKHVPIFNVHDLAESKGLLLPPEELLGNNMLLDDGSSSGGSDDEGGDEENENENDTPAVETSERGVSDVLTNFLVSCDCSY